MALLSVLSATGLASHAPEDTGPDGMKLSRRKILASASAALLTLTSWPAFAKRTRTPSQTAGPFYPVRFENLTTNLTSFGDGAARGEPLRLTTHVEGKRGPIVGARIEIWQADAGGVYRHPDDRRSQAVDPHFAGHGVGETSDQGDVTFATILPVPYTGRPPHIHVRISAPGHKTLTTQLYLPDHPDNEREGRFGSFMFRNKDQLMMTMGDGAAHFDFVL